MKESKFTEKESLELISQMIQQSKKNMEIGGGNILFYYGYPAVILAVVIYLLVHMTHNPVWSALWFLMFVPSIWVNLAKKNRNHEWLLMWIRPLAVHGAFWDGFSSLA